MFVLPFVKSSKVNNNEKRENPWFNEDCEEKRHVFLQKLNTFRTFKNDESRIMMTRARSEYKRTIRCARYEFDWHKTFRFEQAKIVNAKLYWKMLKESANVKSSTTVNLDMFKKYFKAINNPDDPFLRPDEDILYFNERFLQSELQIMFSELNLEFTMQEIQKAVRQLKLGRSGGSDMFINEFLYYRNESL